MKNANFYKKKIIASVLCANMLFINLPASVLASNITGVTPDANNTYNIEAAKVSGNTGFRQYTDFTLDKGHIANLIFKNNQLHFVNLVDNQININGIVNTMQGSNFYNGHAIFVSPGGMIIGASGVLNVGSLTMMAPSQNAYNAFKNGLTADDYKNMADYEYSLKNGNYKSLITNSSGTITINGSIFAREGVEAYARTINIAKGEDVNAHEPGIFAGIKNNNNLLTSNDAAEALFNDLVSNNITNASGFNLEGGKIRLVTNKAQDEIITTVLTSEETVGGNNNQNNNNNTEKKKYQTTTTINVANGLKTTVKKEIKDDDSGESTTEQTIDSTYENSSLSSEGSTISIGNAYIASNDVEIEANAQLSKEVTEDSIKAYGEAEKKAANNNNSQNSNNNNNNNNNNENTTTQDSTSGYKIHKSAMGTADEAKATVIISSSKIKGDSVSVKSNATNSTETYIQLLSPLWEKWVSLLGQDLAIRLFSKLLDVLPNGEDYESLDANTKAQIQEMISELPWQSKEAIVSYFSDKMYKYFDGARANANLSIIGSEIKGASSVDITSNADATLKLTTGNLDSHALLFYGLGSGTESKVTVSGSKISALNETGTGNVGISAYSTINHSIDYDSSNFRTIVDNNGSTTGNATGKYSGYNFSLLNNSISSDTNVTINNIENTEIGSSIEAANVDVKAIGFNKSDINIKNVSNVGENAERSGISATMLINHTDTKADVLVAASTVKANYIDPVTAQEIDLENTTDMNNPVMKDVIYEYGKARFIAENIESIQNKVTTKVQAKKQEYSINTKEMANFSPSYTIKLYDWLNKKFLNKATDKVGSVIDKANLEFSGSAIWNDEINNASSILQGATVNADKVDVHSNILDFTANSAIADAAANSKIGGGAAIIVNNKNNTNIAEIINNSTIQATTALSVDAQTQLPMNPFKLKVGTKSDGGTNKDYYIGVAFDQEDGIDKWDTEFIHSDLMDLLGVIGKNANKEGFQKFLKAVKSPKQTISNLELAMDGLLNNYSKAQSGGQYAGVAGSVVVNSITNNTTANIDSSDITVANGNVVINSANSVVNYDGAGKVDFLITEINDLINKLKNGTPEQRAEASKFGMGGSVIVQNFTNNATATINKSNVTAENGDVNVQSASEEGYINIAVTGAKAQNVAIEGSVSVQNIGGVTKASIEDLANNTNLINAQNVNVSAGKAKIRTKAKGKGSALLGVSGESIVQNPVTHELERNAERDSKDGVLNITIFGTNAMNSGTGVSVGGSVDVSSNEKTVNALVDNAKITATDNINVTANSFNKKIDVLVAGAFTSGVQTSNLPNVANSQEITNDANNNTESLTNNQNLLENNNPNREGAENSEGQTGGATQLATGVANVLTGDNTSSSRNFSASLAATVEVFNDKSAVKTAINNAVLNVGNELNATATKDNFLVNVSGGVAKGDNIGGGAGINIYSNKGIVSSDITGSTITFNSENAKKLNVTATSNHFITDVAMGVGIAGEDSSFGAAVGGSFNSNTLKDTTSAKITNTTVSKKDGAANDIDVNVAANTESKIYNVAGEVGYSNSDKVAIGAGVAGNMDVIEQTVLAQITDNSTLNNAKNTYIDSVLKQHIHSIAIAGEIVTSGTVGFNIGGALGLELLKNKVSAILDGNSKINSTGDFRLKADSLIDGFTATGALNAATTSFSFGAGIGAIVDLDSSEIKAEVNNAKVEKSKSIEVKANSSDKRDFIAANLGGQLSSKGSLGITANGIVSVLKSQIHAQVLNGSELTTDGTLDINSNYINNFKGITALGEAAYKGGAIGANVLVNHFENDVLSEISNDSILNAGSNIGISARTAATLNLIPAAVSIAATGITAVAADVSVDIIKDKTNALAKGNMTSGGNLTVGADDETTLSNRGGTLAASGFQTAADVSGAVNVDLVSKTVNAQIGDENANQSVVNANGTVSVSSVSTNSLGGTKNAQGLYDRDDITSEAYQNQLLTKDEEGNFNGINYTNGFANWNMFYNIALGSQITVPGTVVIKNIQNNVNAKVLNTKLTSNDMNITATDYSVKNLIAGEVAGSKIAAIGAQVYVTKDNSNTSSIIGNNSDITVANTLNLNSWNRKDNKLVFAAAAGSGRGAIDANVLKNTIKDDTIAKIDTNSKVTASTLNINTEEDVNATRIVVAAAGSLNIAIDVSPLINYYGDDSNAVDRKGKIISEISNSTINNAEIGMNASTNIRTKDIAIDAGGALTGFTGSGTAIKNTYNTITKSIIDSNTVINNAQNIKMNANSVFDSNNYAIGASGIGVGANLVANVILNDFISKTESSISDSNIIAKSIELKTNNGKKDNLVNYGIAGGFAGKGISAVVTTIYDVFNNESITKVVNSDIKTNNGGLLLDANSKRTMKNMDISASLGLIGFGGAASALVTKNDSKTLSYIDAKTGNNIDVAGQLYLNAQDTTIADNTLGVGAGGAGAGLACVNLYTSNSLVKSEILSQSANPIKSGSAYIGSASTNAIRNLAVGAAAGLAAIAADVQIIKIGKFGSSYTDTEDKSGIKAAIQKTKEGYDKIATDEEKARYNPEADTTQSVTGVLANINADMQNSGALEMSAKSNIKGVDKNGNLTDTLYLKNVDVTIGGITPAAAVKNLKVANDTNATISGGNITSGDISVNAESNSNVEISSTGVTVSGIALSGGSSIYKNNSNTLAQIGSNDNTKINANNVSVNSKSTSKSDLVTRSVGVQLTGEIAGVNILENVDNNSSLAKITGNTDITASGSVGAHSTINTNLKSRQNTVEVRGADIASIFKNETNASTISKAIIEDVDGTIKSKNINLVSDYGVMQVSNTVDATKVKGVNIVDHDKAKVIMNSTFVSGINAGNVNIENSGNLKIETAKSTSNQSNSISAINTLDEVTATIANFFSGTFGETNNTATSNTYLVAGNNQTGSLTINSYLDSLAKTTTGVRKGGAISVNSAYAESTDLSTLNLTINGTNKITGSATINAIHNASVSSDLEALNVGVGVQGQRARVSATQTSNTIGTISGDYSANSSDINFNTNRNSYISKTTRSGGAISVNDAQSNNTLDGNSTLNINISNASDDLNNKMTVKNTSTNTFDIKSRDTSGGVINVSVVNDHTTLDTKTTTNITNANIKAKDNVSFEVSNNTLVDDTGTAAGGGFIAVLNDTYTRTYTSGAYLNLIDSEIHANDIKLNTHSDISAKRKNEFDFKAGGGGFVAVPKLTLKNNLNQTSEINLINTKLYAKNNAVLSVDTSSWFKVRSDADGRGFVSVPKVWSYLDPTYNHTITLDSNSIIDAVSDAVFNFNSNNTLSSKVSAYAANFAGPPSGYSYLNLNINNTLTNKGTIKAGELADINFMTKSYNDLANHVDTESRAAVAKTWEGADLLKRVTNRLLVPSGAKIISDKDIEVTYLNGRNKFDSKMHWKTISYAVFGIPIENEKTTRPISNIENDELVLDGIMQAGSGSSKKITINKDGTINEEQTIGFSSANYSISGGEIVDGKTIKDKKLNEINSKIIKANSDLEEITNEVSNLENSKLIEEQEKADAQKIIDDFNGLISGDYILKNTNVSEGQETSEFANLIINDIKSQIIGSDDGKLTEKQYGAFVDAYGKEISSIYEYNQAHLDTPKEYTSISVFLAGNTSLGLSDTQKNTVITTYSTVENNNQNVVTPNGNFMTYTTFDGVKYAGVLNPTEVNNVMTCDEVKGLAEKINTLNSDIKEISETVTAYNIVLPLLNTYIESLEAEKTDVANKPESEFTREKDTSYSIVFNDINSQDSTIKIDGMTNKYIKGSGDFVVSEGGVQIDNYSTRSLIFNDIDLGKASNAGLVIYKKAYSEFLGNGTNQAVNGTNSYEYKYPEMNFLINPIQFSQVGTAGVHYKTATIGIGKGIVINNYYDTASPFAASQEITNPTLASDIKFNGSIVSNDIFKVFNDSGSIYLKDFNNDNVKGAVNIVSTKGNIDFVSSGLLKLKTNNNQNNIFAGNGININAGSVDSWIDMTAGYNKDLTLTITDEMLNNLAYDPVTGENILINLGNTPYANASNNIKAVYKDGQIHLYNINNDVKGVDRSQRGKVNITAAGSNTINNDKITAYDKYQKITVNNQTDKQLNVYNVTNLTSNGGYYLNGNKVKDAQGYSKADTSITSTGKLVLDGVIKNAVKMQTGKIVLDSSSNGLASKLLLQSQGNGLELKKQNSISTDNPSANSIYAEGDVSLVNDNSSKSGAEESDSDMIIAGDIEVQGNIYLNQETTGSMNIDSTLRQVGQHVDGSRGQIVIGNQNESDTGGIYFGENTVVYNENGDISIVNASESTVVTDGFIYARKGNVNILNGGTTIDCATSVADSHNIVSVGGNPIIIDGIKIAEKGYISVYNNLSSDLIITEDGALINTSKTPHDISIINGDIGGDLSIKGVVANYSGGDITIENNGGDADISGIIENKPDMEEYVSGYGIITGNINIKNNGGELNLSSDIIADTGDITITNNGDDADISGHIHNEKGHITINNNSGNLATSGVMETDNGVVSINSYGGDAIISGIISAHHREGLYASSIRIENGKDILETGEIGGQDMIITAGLYLDYFDNTRGGQIYITNNAKAGELNILDSEINSQGTDTNIYIGNFSAEDALTIDNTDIIQRDGGLIIVSKNDLSIDDTNIETHNHGLKISGSERGLGDTSINANIKYANDNGTGGNIQIFHGLNANQENNFILDGTIQNENSDIKISSHGSYAEINSAIENYNGSTRISNDGDYIFISSDIVNTGGELSIKNENSTPSDTAALDILGNIANLDGDLKISSNQGALNIDENAVILNISSNDSTYNFDITNSGAGLNLNGTIGNSNGNITVTNTGAEANITGTIETGNGDILISNSNSGALNVSGNIANETGKIAITNNSSDGMVIDYTANIQNNDTTNTEITNTSGSAIIENGAKIVNAQGGNISVSNSGVGLTIEGLIENQGAGKINVDNSGTDALAISETAILHSTNGDIEISNSNNGALTIGGAITDDSGKITVTNNSSGGMVIGSTASIQNKDTKNTEITNTSGSAIIENGAKIVNVQGGNISVSNSGVGLAIEGLIENQGAGKINVDNSGTDALAISETAILHSTNGNIEVANSSTAGIDLIGSVKADKQDIKITNSNSDLRIGTYADSNDNYITALTDNVIITQTGGSILNGISENGVIHQHHDLANVNSAYKTLISANGDITFNVTDGDIGSYSNTEIAAGTSFDASTRDYTESINVQANGLVNAKVVNNTNTDDRLINIRAKESDLKIGTIETDGNVILTATDWKQSDVRPVDTSDSEYFNGYSMLNGRDDNNSNIIGKNISLITSGSFGTTSKKLIYEQDTLNGGSDVSLSAEAENGLHLTGRSNSDANVRVNNVISKHGSADIDFESNAEIEHITADDGLLITQKAQNLTIKEFGTSGGSSAYAFNDMLYPHDDIAFDGTSTESSIPKYVDIKVLDAIGNQGSSTLKIYSGYVKGNNGDNANYYPNGARLADITLMADNIYAVSDKMQTPIYVGGVNSGDTSLTYVIDGETRIAKGLNAYGEGSALTLDILGVDKDVVNNSGISANRNSYNSQVSVQNVPSKFQNYADEIPFYGSDYSAKNVILSVNDYSDRDVNFDTLYTDNAYISTNKDNLHFDNAYINNFAEIKNSNKTAVVDNERIGLLSAADIQLYTKKTGSFNLGLNGTINMITSAPTVYNNPHMLVNGYHSEWNFVNKGQKESKILYDNKKMADFDRYNYNEPQKRITERFDTTNDKGLSSNYEILDISTTGVSVKNNKKLKRGKKTTITLKFDDVDITVNAKVVKVEGDKAGLEFINMPKDVANKILYRYMQKADSMKSNLTSSL